MKVKNRFMSKQMLINKYPGIIKEVQNEIKKLENDTRILNKLYVILDVLHDVPVQEIIKKHDVGQTTVYTWIKQWNSGGIEGLKRKKGSGAQSKLTTEQFIILDKAIQELDLKTAKEVQEKIEVIFGVKYSIRQVQRIMNKLNYTYTKPYPIYDKMPEDAKEQIKKKTSKIDLNNIIFGFLDSKFCSKSG